MLAFWTRVPWPAGYSALVRQSSPPTLLIFTNIYFSWIDRKMYILYIPKRKSSTQKKRACVHEQKYKNITKKLHTIAYNTIVNWPFFLLCPTSLFVNSKHTFLHEEIYISYTCVLQQKTEQTRQQYKYIHIKQLLYIYIYIYKN